MTPLPIARPTLGEEEAEAARAAILSGWVTQGPAVLAFEAAFAAWTGAPHACAVSSCTTALHLALLAVGVRPGDVVITVSHSFIATANAIRHCGAEPVFVDIDPQTYNLCPTALAGCLTDAFEPAEGGLYYRELARLTRGESPLTDYRGSAGRPGRLAAILVVHQIGMPADLARILPIAAGAGVPVVEDAACAIGSRISLDGGVTWEPIGRPHGAVACFSFHPRKVITTGDGGMLTTRDATLDAHYRLRRQHAMSVSDLVRHAADRPVFETYQATGYNYRMTDVQAAIGRVQLTRLAGIVARRRALAERYRAALAGIAGVSTPLEPAYARSNWQSYALRLADPQAQIDVMGALMKLGIQTRRGIMCAHLEAPYAAAWPVGCLPVSEAACDGTILLPLFPEMEDADVDRVVEALGVAVGG